MLTIAAAGTLLTVVAIAGLKGGRPEQVEGRSPLLKGMAAGLGAARRNARIRLAYGCAFVSRADLVVVGTFFVLWLNQAGVAAGLSPDAASRTAGMYFALVMTSALAWAPIAGVLNDRMDRTGAMALAMFLCACGYSVMGIIPDPLGGWMYPAGVLLGIGQMSAITASQTLIGQEAPGAIRGSVIGMFTLSGAAGAMFITSIGGRIFDAIAPSAPFVLIGIINGVLFLAALWVSRSASSASSTPQPDRLQ